MNPTSLDRGPNGYVGEIITGHVPRLHPGTDQEAPRYVWTWRDAVFLSGVELVIVLAGLGIGLLAGWMVYR